MFCPIPPNRDNIDVMNLYKYATTKANIPYATAYIKKSIVYTVNVAIKKAPNIVPAVSSGLPRSFSNAIANIIVTIGKQIVIKFDSYIIPPTLLYSFYLFYVTLIINFLHTQH